MKLSYYPGCSLIGSAREYDHSIRQLAGHLEIELTDIPDWNCCGASSAHMTNHDLAIQLSARNLLLAQKQPLDILVPCAACFQRLKCAEIVLTKDASRFGMEKYSPNAKIVHLTTLFSSKQILSRVRAQLKRDLSGLKVACYYGCLSQRPPRVTGAGRYEDPLGLDQIITALGAEPAAWSHKTECCSGSLTMPRPDISHVLVNEIVGAARRAGAHALVVDCPMCQANLEARQSQVGSKPKAPPDAALPVFFVTELMNLGLKGKSAKRQWKRHLIDPRPTLEPLGW